MSTTIQVSIDVADEAVKDIMIAELADLGFDGFEETETGLFSYIDSAKFGVEVTSGLANLASRHGATYTSKTIEKQNWNALWSPRQFSCAI
jgi:ribosomal protein L11 methyltransferase